MADPTIPGNNEWQKVRRATRAPGFLPIITIRKNGDIAVSTDFVRMADIAECTRASLFFSPDGLRLALRFHSDDKDADAFTFSRDGGRSANKSRATRLITAKAALSQSAVLRALLREDDKVRRFEPSKRDDMWVLDLAPCFERTLTQPGEIAAGATGIYRYKSGQDTVYIGRGNLRTRLAEPDRKEWAFDRIEYSVINDDVVERRWEAFWLDAYRESVGRWPFYNRVGGAAPREQKADDGWTASNPSSGLRRGR